MGLILEVRAESGHVGQFGELVRAHQRPRSLSNPSTSPLHY